MSRKPKIIDENFSLFKTVFELNDKTSAIVKYIISNPSISDTCIESYLNYIKHPKSIDPALLSLSYKHINLVYELNKFGIDLKAKDNCGNTQLHLAARDDLIDLVKQIIPMGMNINERNNYISRVFIIKHRFI